MSSIIISQLSFSVGCGYLFQPKTNNLKFNILSCSILPHLLHGQETSKTHDFSFIRILIILDQINRADPQFKPQKHMTVTFAMG